MLNVNETITFIKPCYKMRCFTPKIWRYAESPYLCNVFFIVLDLRLTKRLAVWEDSLFFMSTYDLYPTLFFGYSYKKKRNR